MTSATIIQTEPFLRREGLTQEKSDLQFLRDLVDLSYSHGNEDQQYAALALERANDAAGQYFITPFDQPSFAVVDAAEELLDELGLTIDWDSGGYAIWE
jgi:hypothetical protein